MNDVTSVVSNEGIHYLLSVPITPRLGGLKQALLFPEFLGVRNWGVGWLWFRVSHKDIISVQACVAVIWGLAWTGRSTSKFTDTVVGWRPQFHSMRASAQDDFPAWQLASPRASGPERKRLQWPQCLLWLSFPSYSICQKKVTNSSPHSKGGDSIGWECQEEGIAGDYLGGWLPLLDLKVTINPTNRVPPT